MSIFDPGKPVEYPLPATRQTITPEAVARGAAALDREFPALGQDFTPAWFVKAAGLVLEAALGMPAPADVGVIGESAGGYGYGPVDDLLDEAELAAPTSAPWADRPEAAVRVGGQLALPAELTLRSGEPLYVNPAYVVSVRNADQPDAPDEELTEVQLAFSPQALLVRGDATDVGMVLWP